ncbi:hypothetical protein NCTGTJJY_CDS0255 [Serratia phage 92A1]|nr:hypothetical protein NCTGTJJY_CDS0255 [Serratia phage 92A1]
MLTLIKETKQENWPLIFSLLNNRRAYPTISEYKANPTKWVAEPHGIYTLEFPANMIKTYYDKETYVTTMLNGKEERLKVVASVEIWMKAFAAGNIVYNGVSVIVTGMFIKSGSVVLFKPLVP